MKNVSTETEILIKRAAAGDRNALDKLFARHRSRLVQAAQQSLDPRLRPRVDGSDIVQEAHADAARRLPGYLKKRPMPFVKWLHWLTAQRVIQAYRKHVVAKRRDVRRERPLEGRRRGTRSRSSSFIPAEQVAARPVAGKDSAEREELRARVRILMRRLDPISREALELRHFKKLKNVQVAERCGISVDAAKKRHARALQELKLLLDGQPGLSRDLLG